MYHVITDENLAAVGTRPEKVKLSDVGPHSEWECGEAWMHGDVEDAIQQGIIKPVSELRLNVEKDNEEYKDGLVFGGDTPDIFCNAVTKKRWSGLWPQGSHPFQLQGEKCKSNSPDNKLFLISLCC